MAGKKWESCEDNYILEQYKNLSVDEIANNLNRTRMTVDARMRALKIRRAKPKIPNIWTKDQIKLLKDNYTKLSREKLSNLIGQSNNNIRNKLKELGLVDSNKRKPYKIQESKRFYDWTDMKIQYLIDNFETLPMKVMMEELGCSGHTIARKAKSIGLKSKKKQTMPEYQVEKILKSLNIKYLKEVYIKEHKFICDFIIDKIIIEVQGDYWHANPLIYNESQLDKTQIYNINRDKIKKETLESLDYSVLYIWEYDLKNNYQQCVDIIKALPPV